MVRPPKLKYCCLLFLMSAIVLPAFSQTNTHKNVSNLDAAGKITYLNLETSAVMTALDTLTNGWDVAFQHTAIILPDKAAAQVVANSSFEKITVAPAGGYRQGRSAVPPGSGNGWYNYNMNTHIISPIPGRVILIRTASGKYVKLVIDSYYKDGADGEPGYYTLHYAFIDTAK